MEMCFVPSIYNQERGRGAAGEAVTAITHLPASTRSDGSCAAAINSRTVGDAAANCRFYTSSECKYSVNRHTARLQHKGGLYFISISA